MLSKKQVNFGQGLDFLIFNQRNRRQIEEKTKNMHKNGRTKLGQISKPKVSYVANKSYLPLGTGRQLGNLLEIPSTATKWPQNLSTWKFWHAEVESEV